MLESYLNPLYERFVATPLAQRCAEKYSAERLTYFACLAGVLVSFALLLNLPNLAVILLFVSGLLDTIDGPVARMTHTASEKGYALGILSDRIVEFAVILGLFAVDPIHRGWLTLIMLGSCYLCVIPNVLQKRRLETFIFFTLMILLPSYFTLLAILFCGLVILTTYLHAKQFLKNHFSK